MLQTTLESSSKKASYCQKEQNVSFCEEIRHFVNESRECQTVYANFEGYHERTVEYDDLPTLENLVFLTLSDGKDRDSLTADKFTEIDKLTKLIAKKIYNLQVKFKSNVIRFQVVWIYYFDYLEKEMKAMPVFKVYKNWGSEALYIDIMVVEYDNWDHFIMHSKFPLSFICVPRRGEYTFRNIDGADLLDLEYICNNSQLQRISHRTIRPLSQTLIQRILHSDFVRIVTPFLKVVIRIADISYLKTHPTVGPILGFISVVGIIFRIVELKMGGEESERRLESTVSNSSLILLNDKGQRPSPWINCLNLMYNVLERPLRDKSWIDVMNCFKNPQQNVMEIFKFVPVIIEVCKPFYSTVAADEEAPLKIFLEFLSKFFSKATDEAKEKGSEKSENWLCNLEKHSSEKVCSELEASCRLSRGKEISEYPIHTEGLQKSGLDLLGCRVYLLVKHTSPDWKRFLQRLLKLNFILQEDTFSQNITFDGNLIGVVIPFSFLSQDHAIIVLRLENCQK